MGRSCDLAFIRILRFFPLVLSERTPDRPVFLSIVRTEEYAFPYEKASKLGRVVRWKWNPSIPVARVQSSRDWYEKKAC
jgi:hypothetical protein